MIFKMIFTKNTPNVINRISVKNGSLKVKFQAWMIYLMYKEQLYPQFVFFLATFYKTA